MKEKPSGGDWAELLSRTFDVDVFACIRCGGRRRVLAYVKEAGGVRAILEHLGLPTAGARRARRAGLPRPREGVTLQPPQPAKRARPLPRPAWEGGWAGQACVYWR
jgi:hypothetical protein